MADPEYVEAMTTRYGYKLNNLSQP